MPLVLVTGTPGVGKSTVAGLVAARLPVAAHVKADALHRLIVSGGEWPSTGSQRAQELHLLRTRNALALAANFRSEGIVPIVDEVLDLPGHAQLVEEAGPTHVFALTAGWDTVLVRDANRRKHTAALYRDTEAQIRRVLGGATWIDTTDLEPDEVASRILHALD